MLGYDIRHTLASSGGLSARRLWLAMCCVWSCMRSCCGGSFAGGLRVSFLFFSFSLTFLFLFLFFSFHFFFFFHELILYVFSDIKEKKINVMHVGNGK